MEVIQLSLFGKMFPERSVQTAEKTSTPCWKNLPAWNNQTLQFLDLRGGGRWSKAGAIAGNGWSLAWRQLDAQYWGVPQRRKRIALVVDFAGGRAGKILFERESLQGHPEQSIQTWQEAARTAGNRPAGNDRMVGQQGGQAYTLKIRSGCAGGGKGALVQTEKTGTLSTLQDQTLFQAIPVLNDQGGEAMSVSYNITGTLDTMHDAQAVAIECSGCLNPWDTQARRVYGEDGAFPALPSRGTAGGNQQAVLAGQRTRWIVRRLTPTECERLQGYPDGWTDIGEWVDTKGKKHKPADSPRYKALGNSIALPQWFWIAQKMKSYMGDGAKLGSLFDGIGGFPLVWETTYGTGTARWASEIEEFPIAVTKKHFPERNEHEN